MSIFTPITTWLGAPAGVEFRIALLLALLYWGVVLLIRWHLVARPVLRNLEARISKVRVDASAQATAAPSVAGEIDKLLSQARDAIQKLNALDFLFWNRGQEAAGWQLVHEAERRRVAFMAPDEVRVRLATAIEELRATGSDTLKALAGKLEALSQQTTPAVDPKVLLDEALRVLYKARDEKFFVLINWNNKLNWLGLCSLVLIVALAGSVMRSVLFLAGAAGGLISRLTRQVKTQEIPRDYGSGWTTLFLSPLFGALAGWTGVLIVHVLSTDSQYLGRAFQNLWDNPYGPEALAVALLMGLTERAFDKMVGALETRLAPRAAGGGEAKETPKPQAPTPAPAPKPPVEPPAQEQDTAGKTAQ